MALMRDRPAGQAQDAMLCLIGPLAPSAANTAAPIVPPAGSFRLETAARPVEAGRGDMQLHWAPAVPGALPRLACISAMSRGQTSVAWRQALLPAVGCEVLYLPWPGVPWAYWSPDAQTICGAADERLRIYEWGSDLELAVPMPFTSEPAALIAWSPASDFVLHVHSGVARLVKLRTGRVSSRQQLWRPHLREAAGLVWSSAGTAALFSISDVQSGIALYCLAPDKTLQQLRWVDTSCFVACMTFSSCGQLLAWAEHGHRPAHYFGAQSIVRVAHAPSGRVAVVTQLPFSRFAPYNAGRPRDLAGPVVKHGIDLYWQPDSSLIFVGPERSDKQVLVVWRESTRWPVTHFVFGAPIRTWAAFSYQCLRKIWGSSVFKLLSTFVWWKHSYGCYQRSSDWRWSALYLVYMVLMQMGTVKEVAADWWCWLLSCARVLLHQAEFQSRWH